MPRLSVRIDLDGGERIGPGKVALLKAVGETGSIAAAGRAARHVVPPRLEADRGTERLASSAPLVTAQTGGKSGGGAGTDRARPSP